MKHRLGSASLLARRVDRRAFLGSLAILAGPRGAAAQKPASAVRIGWLGLASPGPEVLRIVDAFKHGLRLLGYVEGQHVAFEYRWAHGQSERLPDLVAELIQLKVDIIAVANTLGALAARQATNTLPIVFLGADPEQLGLGPRLARPGGNITGVTLVAGPEIAGKYLELLNEAVAKLARVAVLVRPDNSAHARYVKEMETAARPSKIRLQRVGAKTPDELDAAFAAMTRARTDGLVVLSDPIFFLHRERLAELAARTRLPAMYGFTEHAEAGGLMAYSANFADVARRAASHVDRIIRGAKPGDLPIEQPTTFELALNLRTAKALGLTVPPSLLQRATRVIE